MQQKCSDLVLLPGWGFHASVFDVMLPHFRDYNVHCVELPSLNHPEANELDALAQSLPPRASITGWSLGGLVAIELCSRFPQQFSSLILLASSPKFVAADNWNGITTQHAQVFMNRANSDLPSLMNAFHKLACLPDHTILRHLNTHARVDDQLMGQLHYLFNADLREQYFSLQQPVLSLAGERDSILPAHPSAEIIKDAGHAFPFTHHADVCRRILHFMEQTR